MPKEAMKQVRVLQGHSVEYGGVWFNQGDVLTVPEGARFELARPKHDKSGKHLGDEVIPQVETITPAEKPARTKETKKEEE